MLKRSGILRRGRALINQGSGAVELRARFFDGTGQVYRIEPTSDTTAVARIEDQPRQGPRLPTQGRFETDALDCSNL